MKCVLLTILLVVLAKNQETQANLVKIAKVAVKVLRYVAKIAFKVVKSAVGLYKRDIHEMDKNMDGLIDQSEMEEILNTRDARDILELADEDGNSQVTLDELQKFITEMSNVPVH